MFARGGAPLLLVTVSFALSALFTVGTCAQADSFLTDETFFPISEEQSQRLEALSWESTIEPLAALDEDADPLFHMRLITRAYFQWAMEAETADLAEEFVSVLDQRARDAGDDYLRLLDLGYAVMVLYDDLNGLRVLEAASVQPSEEAAESEEAPPVTERAEPAVFLALGLCYAQTDGFVLGKLWSETTNLKREAVLDLQKAADYAFGHPQQASYAEALALVLDYMSYYEGFSEPLQQADLASQVEALFEVPEEGD